jgi:hypothetical protein
MNFLYILDIIQLNNYSKNLKPQSILKIKSLKESPLQTDKKNLIADINTQIPNKISSLNID